MNDFYTNVYCKKNIMLVRGYLDGKRYKQVTKYKPYLFLPTKNESKFKNLNGDYVDKKQFESVSEARNFVRTYSEIENFSIYGLDKFVYTYIYDNYPKEIKYDVNLIKSWNIDIETDSSDGFADIQLANKPITLIGIKIKDKKIIFGHLDDYRSTDENVEYIKCVHEKDMLMQFLDFWDDEENGPDVVTGWNIENYDIPYLVNRITNLLGEEAVKRLSPWRILNQKTFESRGKEILTYTPVGIAVLDYYLLYKKFTYVNQESYSLDHIAFVEVKKRKLDYSEYESLDALCKNNYTKFVDYNIADLDRVSDIDEKNKFIELVYAIAYDAKINFVDALTSVLLWDIICHNYLLDRNIVIPSFKIKPFIDIPGGFVKDPQVGMHNWVVSFDVQSEYPHAIMMFNISPETLIGINTWDNNKIEGFIYSDETFENETFIQAGNGARFRKDKVGFLPELMRLQFQLRLNYKNKMLQLKKESETNDSKELKNEISKYDNLQKAKKIQLNSLYGSLANIYCRYYDWRLASAITLSSQLCIRYIEKHINEYFNNLLKTQNVDYIIAIDTDSCYVNFDPLIKKMGLTEKDKIVEFIDSICQEKIQPYITKCFEKLAKRVNTKNEMYMKREAISDKAVWKAKKMYIMNVLNNEGVNYKEPEIKIMGMEAVRSSTPQACRDAIKDVMKIILNKDEITLQKYIIEFRNKFKSLPFEDIAFPRGVNGIEKYHDSTNIFKSATPIHVRASLIYNNLIDKMKLKNKFPIIFNKDKIKFCYLILPNPCNSNVIAAPKILPKQFGIEKYIDYDTQFDKTFLEPIKAMIQPIGWSVEKTNNLEEFFN